MISTRVGYTGGMSPNPTYHNLEQHSESIEITYDPAVISYEQSRSNPPGGVPSGECRCC